MSKIEERHSDIAHQKNLPYTFKDSKGAEFKAKADALITLPDGDTAYIEFKEHPLNTKTTKSSADNKLTNQYKYRFRTKDAPNPRECEQRLYYSKHNKDVLDHAWHHSGAKHKSVSDTLKKHGIRYIVVFSSHEPEIEYRGKMYTFKHFYKKLYNLETMLEPEFLKLKETALPITIQ